MLSFVIQLLCKFIRIGAIMNKYTNTYCNPIPLPDYPLGRMGLDREYNWRETADPTVLYENGIWYLYSLTI